MLSPSLAFLLVLLGFVLIYWEFVRPGLLFPGIAGSMAVLAGFYAWLAAHPAWPGLAGLLVAAVLFAWDFFVSVRFLVGAVATLALAYGAARLFSGPKQISPALSILGSCAFGWLTMRLADIAKRARRNKRDTAFSGR
ncbi:MAG TPA: hypothetical protein VHZ55_29125 [Bryobacteraceae bacterium]|jgi:membrane-bound serine protease (ClpP class)|nr:hypothetical protein [Bryobacteraceae bacterium]